MKYLLIFLLIFSYSMQSQGGSQPTYLDIEILSALIGPLKVNDRPWDSKSSVNPSAVALVSEMMLPGSGAAASSVISAVKSAAPHGTAAPDVIGYIVQRGPTIKALVSVAGTPMALALKHQKTQDSYTPRFFANYQGWPVFEGTRFQIQLWDADLLENDQIAVVEINYKHLLDAAEKGKPTWINVADQSLNQLLYILVSVSHSLKSTRPKMNGIRWN